MPSGSPVVSFCERVTPQEYQEQTLITSQHSLKDLLNKIVEDESLSAKERRKQLKQVSILVEKKHQYTFLIFSVNKNMHRLI